MKSKVHKRKTLNKTFKKCAIILALPTLIWIIGLFLIANSLK